MVILTVLFSGAALFFIMTKSDGLRAASRSGDVLALSQLGSQGVDFDVITDVFDMDAFEKGINWSKLDPRRLWRERTRTVRLNPKTIHVDPNAEPVNVTEFLISQGIDPSTVRTVKID